MQPLRDKGSSWRPLLPEHCFPEPRNSEPFAWGRESHQQIDQIWMHLVLSAFCELGLFTCFRIPGWCCDSYLTDEKTEAQNDHGYTMADMELESELLGQLPLQHASEILG